MPHGEVGDLREMSSIADLEKKCAKALLSIGPGRTISTQLWEFAKQVKLEDIMIASKAGLILGAGRVIREYYFDSSLANIFQDSSIMPHRLGVDWTKIFGAGVNTRSIDQRAFRSLFFPQDIIHEITDQEAKRKIAELVSL